HQGFHRQTPFTLRITDNQWLLNLRWRRAGLHLRQIIDYLLQLTRAQLLPKDFRHRVIWERLYDISTGIHDRLHDVFCWRFCSTFIRGILYALWSACTFFKFRTDSAHGSRDAWNRMA